MIETNVIYYGDNIAEPKTRKLIPSPASPEMPIIEILMEMAYNSGHMAPHRSAKIAKATSHVRKTLSEMAAIALMEDDKDVKIG